MGRLATVPIDFRPARPVSGAKPAPGDHALVRAADPFKTLSLVEASYETNRQRTIKRICRLCVVCHIFGSFVELGIFDFIVVTGAEAKSDQRQSNSQR